MDRRHAVADFRDDADPNADVWFRYTRYLETAGRSPRTRQSYTASCQLLADHCKGADLLNATREDIQAFLAEQKRLHSHGTVLVRFRSIRAFHNWAKREDWITESPMNGMPVP